jgi:hypothetical protein
MGAELASLASSAAATIANLLATDAWEQVKKKIGVLWRRFRPDQAAGIEAELERGHLEIRDADDTVALAITRDWESRLLRLLDAEPTVADELSRVVAELRQVQAGRPGQGRVWQSAKASGRSTVIQVGGNATLGQPIPLPDRRPPGAQSP